MLSGKVFKPLRIHHKSPNVNVKVNISVLVFNVLQHDSKINAEKSLYKNGKNGKVVAINSRKSTFSGVFTNYEGFIPTYQKRGLLHKLLHRNFSIRCDFKTFHLEVDRLNTILRKNNYPPNSTDYCTKSFLNKLYTPKVVAQNVSKRNVLLSCRSWAVLRFNFERSFKNYLLINWRLAI